MSEIKFNNLQSSGSQLFADSESFLTELSQDEIEVVHGAGHYRVSIATIITPTSAATVAHPPTGTYVTVPGGNSGINCTNFYTGGIKTIYTGRETTLYRPHPTELTPVAMTKAEYNYNNG